jgi:hypothetical protein
MACYASAYQRSQLIAGLRALAEFLEADPGVPAPVSTDVLVFPTFSTNAERRAEIDIIASRIGTRTLEYVPGHYTVSRYFGPVEYRAVAIDRYTNLSTDGA